MSVDNWMQISIPSVGIIIAVVSAALTYYFTKRQQILADERRLKEKCYLEFIEALSNNVLSSDIESAKSRLSEAHNQILLIGDPQVVSNLRVFANYIGPQNSTFRQEEHDKLLTELIKSMRLDLYKKININKNYPIIGLSGKNRRSD